MVNCQNCNKETSNSKFCSQSCSATVTNRIPKRKRKIKFCLDCKVELSKERQVKRCKQCHKQFRISERKEKPNYVVSVTHLKWNDVTLLEARNHYKKEGRSPSYAHSLVRMHCGMLFKHLKEKCTICDYTKHVELCHIRGIASFPETALFSEINAPENIIGLCPNHHWELDNDHLTL